jgi:hypothetical protein
MIKDIEKIIKNMNSSLLTSSEAASLLVSRLADIQDDKNLHDSFCRVPESLRQEIVTMTASLLSGDISLPLCLGPAPAKGEIEIEMSKIRLLSDKLEKFNSNTISATTTQ